MNIYEIKGKFLMGEKMRSFTKEVKAANEKRAREFIYTDLGSKHKVKRNKIKIDEIKEKKAS